MVRTWALGAIALAIGCKGYEVVDGQPDADETDSRTQVDDAARSDVFGGDGDLVDDAPPGDAGVPDARDAFVPDATLGPLGFVPTNGIRWMDGADIAKTTTLAGTCQIYGEIGKILCDGVQIRLNVPDVGSGIGWTVTSPIAPNCNGTDAGAPRIAVFSFGSLVIASGATVSVEGKHAVALVAANTIDVRGALDARAGASDSYGPAPGAPPPFCDAGAVCSGGGGAGGATPGGNGGGPLGAKGGPALVPQVDPLCGGSMRGGGVLALVAGVKVTMSGPATGVGCGVKAAGAGGSVSSWSFGTPGQAGNGGGSGGTVLIESPSFGLVPPCVVACNGGGGGGAGGSSPMAGCSSPTGVSGGWPGGSATMTLDAAVGGDGGSGCPPGGRGGSGGALGTPATSGGASTGASGGGGGGAAGFVHLRVADCAATATLPISPKPTCSTL
jgi:hypothetical protein